MTAKKYTEEEKQTAVALFLSEGATNAATTIGCSRQSIYQWLGEYGVDSVNDQKRIDTAERHRAKRDALIEAMLDAALHHAVASMDADTATDAQRHSVAFGIFDDKLNRTAGGFSAPFVLTEEFLNQEIARLEGELGVIAPSNARANRLVDESEIDRALRQTINELERRIRSDYQKEMSGKDKLGRVVNPKRWDEVADTLNGHEPPEGDLQEDF